MLYTFNQLLQYLYQTTDEIYSIFLNFFGEEHVDYLTPKNRVLKDLVTEFLSDYNILPVNTNEAEASFNLSENQLEQLKQHCAEVTSFIYVWWPEVTVTNEYDYSIKIQDLYAKIEVTLEGKIPYENLGFLLNRTTYTAAQFNSGYLHSHIREIPKDDFSKFMKPCLGRGPIENTIGSLKNNYDSLLWMLFCQELAMYVTIESLTGGPWIRLETVGKLSPLNTHQEYSYNIEDCSPFLLLFDKSVLKEFSQYYLKQGHLTLSYVEGKFIPGMPYHEYIIDVSNAFIDFFNKNLCGSQPDLINSCFRNQLLFTCIFKDGSFYQNTTTQYNYDDFNRYQGQYVLTFKGKPIQLNIIKETQEASTTIILNNTVAQYILSNILKTINYRYNNNFNNRVNGTTNNTTAQTYKKVCYL